MLLTLLVLPAVYAMWRRHQVRVAMAAGLSHDAVATSEGCPPSSNRPKTPSSVNVSNTGVNGEPCARAE
jgi:hypothetical protein